MRIFASKLNEEVTERKQVHACRLKGFRQMADQGSDLLGVKIECVDVANYMAETAESIEVTYRFGVRNCGADTWYRRTHLP
jgi:hypothetical protein